jgi:spore photoproduct lyase
MPYNTISDVPDNIIEERNRLITKVNNGRFWKSCPGTGTGYYCCGYQILTPLTGCGMYCSYCVLQEYYDHQYQVLYENYDDLVTEVRQGLEKWQGVIRFGTGEFCDSLYLEETLGLSRKIAKLLEPYPNVLVEFKTKSAAVSTLKDIDKPEKVVIGFSMNTPYLVSLLENGTASLSGRLEAARRCEDMGFWIAFHFDPMVWYPNWKEEYRRVAERIFSTLQDPSHIAWWSLGGFRTMPALKNRLREYGRHLPLFSGEIIIGNDKKYRYFRPIRTEFYSAMQEIIEKYYPDTTLYLCMESREVWEAAGMLKRIPNGLVEYLDERARVMLGMKQENNKQWEM